LSDLLSRVNWIDIFALILFIKIGYASSRIGVGKQILPLIILALILIISLYNYETVASFFIGRYSFMPSVCKFLSFSLMAFVFSIIYSIIIRMTGMALFSTETEAGGIEKIGGIIFGVPRSFLIIGLVLIAFLLVPVKFAESSVRNSFLGRFIISMDVKAYTLGVNLGLKNNEVTYKKEMSKLFGKKEGYLFQSDEKRKKSRFYKEEF